MYNQAISLILIRAWSCPLPTAHPHWSSRPWHHQVPLPCLLFWLKAGQLQWVDSNI